MKNNLIYFIEETDSSNSLLKNIAQTRAENGTPLEDFFTVCAASQKAGRGLHKNVWQSNKGENLLVSLYFTPPLHPSQQFLFNQCFALSVRDALSKYSDYAQIKWSNDIYIKDKKIAGILIEHTLTGDKIVQTIAGVGININQTEFDPAIPNPTSLRSETGESYDLSRILNELLNSCKKYYAYLTTHQYGILEKEYLHYLYRLGEIKRYCISGKNVEAKIVGVDKYGRLLLEDTAGIGHCCGLKEVIFMR